MTRWLTPDEDRAWRGWLSMSALLRSQIGRDLQSDCGLSEPDFSVLVVLSEAADRRLRMSDLVAHLRWSKSRLSHQLTRMEARGLVRREGCTNDARSAYAALTADGLAEVERAAPLHVDSVRRHFVDRLDAEQLRALVAVSDAVVAHLLEIEVTDGCPSGGDITGPGCG